jgi:hypothetical protein
VIHFVLVFSAVCLLLEFDQHRTGASAGPVFERINLAAAANGVTATASSFQDAFPVEAVIDGDRKGIDLGKGNGGWRDDTQADFPDTITVEFGGAAVIDEVNVITQQDTWWNPSEPTEAQVFFNNGITSFEVQFWNGTNFVTIPGLTVTNNNKVWRRFTFPGVTTDKIRFVSHAARLPWSTVIELEALGTLVDPPDPSPTPNPSPTPGGTLEAALAARGVFFDSANNVGFGTTNPIFNDDGTTGALVGKFVAIDAGVTGASAYLGLGGTIPKPHERVGLLNFYNLAMGGADNRTASILSFNGATLGTGTLEFATSPNFIGPVRRMQIAPTGEVGINHNASPGATLTVMGRSTTSSTHSLSLVNGQDQGVLTVRDDGQIFVAQPGQGIVLRSPNGFVCRKLVLNDSGELVIQHMPSCP